MPFSERLQGEINDFRDRVFTDPIAVLDPEGIHHEFVSGAHGHKLDFDNVPTGSDMFIHWVSVYARALKEMYPARRPDVVVGIANGANRLADHVGHLLGIKSLTTEKVDAKTVRLDEDALGYLDDNEVKFAVTVEDVGTTGSTTLTAVTDLRQVGVRRIESTNGWIRNPGLAKLDEARVPYKAVIHHPLPTFQPADCQRLPEGFCAQGELLIPHGS